MSQHYWILILLFTFSKATVHAQLFDSEENKRLVSVAAQYIYNQQPEEAKKAMEAVNRALPNHPMGPMMNAVYILWREIPMKTTDPVFLEFEKELRLVIEKAENLPEKYHEEKIFFDMSARALLAEHYADEGAYMKALNEARKTYASVKEGFDLVEENPEFLLTTGLYNYFRVAYPEKYPVYRSFVWVFREGDKEKGLQQLHLATKETIISRVEAYLYLSYIYLRYENDDLMAFEVLSELYNKYPNNNYFLTKYVEALLINRYFEKAYPLIEKLQQHDKVYYRATGNVYMGIYQEEYELRTIRALTAYNLAISEVEDLRGQGGHYVSQAYLGAGRCYKKFGNKQRSKEYFELALEYAETPWVKDEAKRLLKEVE